MGYNCVILLKIFPMPRESVLTMAEKDAIKIEKFIFHIILKDEMNPHYLQEVQISDEQKEFFKNRLAEAAQGRQYIFNENSKLRSLVSQILIANNADFLRLSKEITYNFKLTHTNATTDGVFIICKASTGKRRLLFLVKLEHKRIYQYKVNSSNSTAILNEVKNTFTEDKSAIQKVALIDIDDDVVWDVLVTDRSARSDKSYITDYFRNFLSVLPRETDADLTKKAIATVNKWASNNKQDLDPEQEVSSYKMRGKLYLMNHDSFDTEEFIEAIVQDPDHVRREKLQKSMHDTMVQTGLAGQKFEIKKDALSKAISKNVRLTAEGVKIEWEGNAADNNVRIPNTPDENGDYLITIRTSTIREVQ